MSDMASDWAGVLSRWGNGVEDARLTSSVSSVTREASVISTREARHSSTGAGILSSWNRESGSREARGEATEMKRSGGTGSGLKRSDSQLRDRQERSAAAGGQRTVSSSGARPKWSYRGWESPGKENVDSGDR